MEGPLVLDRYRCLESAGTGASGSVDICWDTRIQRRVAIKRIPLSTQGPLSGEGTPGLAEARTAALLKHPAIVNLLDFEIENEDALLIMEAVEGPSLSEIIEDVGTEHLDLDIAATIIEAVASALDYAHENQVLHLDIKPDNILIDQSGRPKVSDFGIAELADAQGFRQACGGTIGYMPPEQICGQELDQRCDLFALAMCTYEMLTGYNPFCADTIDSSLMKIEAFSFDPPSYFREDLDPEIDDVLITAMQPDKEERQETVVDFIEELRPFLGNPRIGQEKLRRAINGKNTEEDEFENESAENAPFLLTGDVWNSFSEKTKKIAAKSCAAVLTWWLSAFALMAYGHLQTEIALLGGLIGAIIAGFTPSIGAGLALCALGGAFIYLPQIPTLAGILLLVGTILWWIFIAHHCTAAVNITLLAAPIALIYGTPFIPLLAGFCLKPKQAIATSLMAGILILTLGLATGTESMLKIDSSIVQGTDPNMLLASAWGTPIVWITYVSWPICTLFMSLCCVTNKKFVNILGAFLATAILFGTQLLAEWLQVGTVMLPSSAWCLAHLLALICIIAICALGSAPRTRTEG